MNTYQEMYEKAQRGLITEAEWTAFVQNYFFNMIETDKELLNVFKRLAKT